MHPLVKLLGQTWLLDHLPDHALSALLERVQTRSFSNGQAIYYARTPREAVYFIEQGEVQLLHGIGQAPVLVATVGAGGVLGERVLLGDPTHVLSARARGDVRLHELPLAAFEAFAAEYPDLHEALLVRVVRRIGEDLQDMRPPLSPDAYRIEHDLLGDRQVPADALYGIQTLRAIENFPISGIAISNYPYLIEALACIKQAAARANAELGLLDQERKQWIESACDEIRGSQWHDQFVVDAIQGGAGTSTNMNANEVIANRALELAGKQRGDYAFLHPLNHVNMSQSTNDVYPTAVKIALWFSLEQLVEAMDDLKREFNRKALEFKDVLKIGRTQLQDAVPMTVGQEMSTYAVMLEEDQLRVREAANLLCEINMGATAIGTGITAHPNYAALVCDHLREITDIPLQTAPNLIEATQDAGVFVQLSGTLKRVAVKLSKTCNDLRLLSSGPRAGLSEINLPPMQPGSSIMPGKVNPVIPEVVNQVAFEVIGNDMTVTMAAEAGQLQLNAFEPIIAYSLFNSITHLRNACVTLAKRCVSGITVNHDTLQQQVERSIGLVTALNPYIGYENATRVAREALQSGRSVYSLILEHGLLSQQQLDEILKPENMTQPRWVDVGRE